jgi:Lrp/AsnC family transcriptional regulator, leucine-responsive regulatory protein
MRMDTQITLDPADRKLLAILQQEGRITNAALAERVHLSPSACLARVRRLEEAGVIEKYVALVNPRHIGLTVNVLLFVTLSKQIDKALKTFEAAILDRPEVVECFLMTGDADYLLHVIVKDVQAYERLVLDHLTKIPGVDKIRSSFSLKQVKFETALPV